MSFDSWNSEPLEDTSSGGEPFNAGAGKEAAGFMWHPSYTETLKRIKDRDQQTEFLFGVIGYGAYGNLPAFKYPLDALFEAVKPNIDTSKKKIEGGKKGGRPRKAEEES